MAKCEALAQSLGDIPFECLLRKQLAALDWRQKRFLGRPRNLVVTSPRLFSPSFHGQSSSDVWADAWHMRQANNHANDFLED